LADQVIVAKEELRQHSEIKTINEILIRPLNDFLIERKDQEELSKSMSLPMLKISISDFNSGLEAALTNKMKIASKRINTGENDYVIYSD
jgi:hypothetical protein